MLRIIRTVNANANDSHVDYHMYFGIGANKIEGVRPNSSLGVRIMPFMTLGA